ncbi:acetyl-CoA carboxylase biotin carboxyl carrier protein [Mycoplasma sp. P36-A1]|uniref:acetyl-CoA carboxylase biotin carboxyl carrier protein n=1 Tax=Mycoplasma sp. P36-A1 TaxID=3252900 RepID=UPI003C2AFD9E
MDIDKIKQLVKILEDSSLTELEVKDKDIKIKLGKKNENVVINSTTPHNNQILSNNIESVEKALSLNTLKAPLVGTYYDRPSPDKNAFVKVGDKVNKGDVICIIEAMKVMNEIKAEKSGVIAKILVEDGSLVEYDQSLFELE